MTAARMPPVVHLIAVGVFLMGTTEFMIAGLLPQAAADLDVTVARAGLLVTAFAVGMVVGPPVMALATLALPPRATLVLSLLVFAAGHAVAAVSDSFPVVLATRLVTALATGTFWAVGAVAASAAAGPGRSARALAVMSGGLGLAVVAGVPLGTFVGRLTGWRGPFWLLAVLALPVAAALLRPAPAALGRTGGAVSVRAELRAVRPWRVWAVLGTMVLAQAGFLGAYSYISPLLTDRAGIAAGYVPLVLVGFGAGALLGTVVGGRLGDRRPLATIAVAVTATAVALATLAAASTHPVVVVALVVLIGATGLGANPVLIAQALRNAGEGSTLASSLATSAFNAGTAAGTAVAAAALAGPWGAVGPSAVGAPITASALVLLAVLALTARNRSHPIEPVPAHPSPAAGTRGEPERLAR